MALRLIEIVLPNEHAEKALAILGAPDLLGLWRDSLAEGRTLFRVLVNAEQTESLMDELEKAFSSCDGFRVLLFSVEATLPRPEEPKKDEEPETDSPPTEAKRVSERISREELYADLSEETRLTPNYGIRVLLSAAVAAIGLIKGDVAIIIGAMVIAPLLGSNMSLALATALGDRALAVKSMKTAGVGLALAFLLALLTGLLFGADSSVPAIAERTDVDLGHVVLALASGCAGALAFTRGISTALVGVMVAVALLPPLVVAGLLLALPDFQGATGALMLLAVNLICVNLAAVGTFLLQGIKPGTWWEAERAKRAARLALAVWITLLALLVLLIIAGDGWFSPGAIPPSP